MGIEWGRGEKFIFQNKIEKNQMGRGVRKISQTAVKIVEKTTFHGGEDLVSLWKNML